MLTAVSVENRLDALKNMLNSEKHACIDCFQALREKEPKKDWGKVHVDIPPDKIDEVMPQLLSEILLEKVFSQLWNENKNELRGKSKKEIAELMFTLGVESAVDMIRSAENEIEDDEKEAT